MKKFGRKQYIGGPLTVVLALAAGYLYNFGFALFIAWVGLVQFFLVPLGVGGKASGSIGSDDSDGGHGGDHGGDRGGDGGGSG